MTNSQSRTTSVRWNVIDDVAGLANATTRSHHPLDDATVEEFQRDGACYVPGAFADWVEPLRAGCMRSPTAQFFHEHAFAKESGTQKATPWHHDLPYYCIDGSQTASVYVALDDTPAETAVRFLAGSHRDGNTYVPRRFRTGNDYDYDDPSMVSAPRFDGDDDDEPIIARSLTAGDAIVFDFRTLHGTTDAPVSTRRRAFSTRWLGDDVRYVERAGVTSPPLDLDLDPGDRMPESLFPTLWRDR